jgi:hypothetical protein
MEILSPTENDGIDGDVRICALEAELAKKS